MTSTHLLAHQPECNGHKLAARLYQRLQGLDRLGICPCDGVAVGNLQDDLHRVPWRGCQQAHARTEKLAVSQDAPFPVQRPCMDVIPLPWHNLLQRVDAPHCCSRTLMPGSAARQNSQPIPCVGTGHVHVMECCMRRKTWVGTSGRAWERSAPHAPMQAVHAKQARLQSATCYRRMSHLHRCDCLTSFSSARRCHAEGLGCPALFKIVEGHWLERTRLHPNGPWSSSTGFKACDS